MATLERAGYAPASEPIPVSPAAHYAIGGIVTDLDGTTTVPGLYAAGECAAPAFTARIGSRRTRCSSASSSAAAPGSPRSSGPALEADAAPLEHFADPGTRALAGRWV